MIVALPKSTVHPRVAILVQHEPTQFESNTIADITSMSEVEIETPEGVDVNELEITARFCNARGQHDEGMGVEVIQEATFKEEPEETSNDGQSDETPKAGEETKAAEVGEASEVGPTDEELEALTNPTSSPNGDETK